MSFKSLAVLCAVVFQGALAQQSAYGQCGGIGWSGATSCVSGWTCVVQNSYYAQCLPGTATTTTTTKSSSTVSSPSSTPTSKATTNFWFSFGDSYTQTDFAPNGTLPVIGNPLGNPPYPGYTAVGGTNWIDLDTTVYNKSLILTYNYAYGGATINASLVTPYEPTVLSLGDQVNQFLTGGVANKPSYAAWTSQNALFSFWIGINDIGNSYGNGGNRSAFSDTLMDAYFGLVQKLYNVGARNFLFVNVPPIDRSPLMLAQSTAAQALEKSVIADYNAKLVTRASAFKANNTGVSTWIWDANTAFSTILNNPQAYGFTDITSFGNTGDFWGNNYHPSSAAHTFFGQDVANVLNSTVW